MLYAWDVRSGALLGSVHACADAVCCVAYNRTRALAVVGDSEGHLICIHVQLRLTTTVHINQFIIAVLHGQCQSHAMHVVFLGNMPC